MNEHDQEVVHKFVDRARNTQSTDGLTVTYRISGGAPGDSIDEHVEVGGDQVIRVQFRDEVVTSRSGEAESTPSGGETMELYRLLADALLHMTSREEARFLPDALVGSVTIEIDGQTSTLFFDADRDELHARGLEDSPALTEAVEGIRQLTGELLSRGAD